MLNKMSMQSKLIALSLGISSVGLIVGGFSYVGLRNVSADYSHVSHEVLSDTKALGEIIATFRRVRLVLRTLGLAGLSRADNDATVVEVNKKIVELDAEIEKYKADGLDPGESDLYEKMALSWQNFKLIGVDVLKYNALHSPDGQAKILEIFLGICPASAKIFTDNIMSMIAFQDANAKSWVQKAESSVKQATMVSIGVSLLGVIASLFAGIFFARSLARTFGGVAGQLSQGATNVSNESGEISNASQSLSAASTQQAAALQETVASIEEVSSMVAKNAEAAKRGREVAETSNEASIRGQKAVADMIRSISEISESNTQIENQVNASNRDITDIVKVISEIGERTKVINDIVFQTKLLSFNASVEAARAGDHGKGFAVVAEEVGKLAQMSGDAAKEISDMLSASILKVETIVENTKTRVETLIVQGKTKLEQGTENAHNCAQVLDEIVKNVSEVKLLVGEIATASSEQAQGVHEINRAMSELDQAAQKNTATSQSTASAAESLTSQASDLRVMVSTLMNAVYGEGNALAVEPSASTRSAVNSRSPTPINKSIKRDHLRAVPHSTRVAAREPVSYKVVGGLPVSTDSRFEDV